jgi:D-alanyl-lipoteichoic acid acyltransferase DltB (MBOAT superfamily)
LGFLGVFKYYNFFADSFVEAFSLFGMAIKPTSLDIILPVGISFYTFQTLSYTIDIYKKRLEPARHWVDFFAFVSFFPQLVAGPIERATNLLPQFYQKRSFDLHRATDGCRQILWGFFKKMVVADNCAAMANQIFENYETASGFSLFLGALYFTFQIYGDFSGYSDIAIGTSRLFGFNLMRNFAFPYFSRDIAEFWRRWHISLSTWFRDYLYIPLGGSRGGLKMKLRNTFIIFVVSGFWHGANWTFIIWGFLNALYFLPVMLSDRNRNNMGITAEGRMFPTFREFFQMGTTFLLTVLAWIFFRANTVGDAFAYITRMLTNYTFDSADIAKTTILFVLFMTLVEWLQRDKQHGLEHLALPKTARYILYYFLVVCIFYFGGTQQTFIYFQF